MNKRTSNLLKFFIFLAIGVLLVWLSLRGLTPDNKAQIKDALQRADYTWIIISIAVGQLSHLSRAVRWKMLMEPLHHKPKLSNTFFAVMVGYLANYAVPRLGEVSRCEVLRRYEKIPFGESFGTVIVERLVDVLCFLILAVIVFFLQFGKLYGYLVDDFYPKLVIKFTSHGILLYSFISFGLLVLFLILLFRRKIFNAMSGKTKKLWQDFEHGLRTIRQLRSPWLFVLHSFFIWFIYYAMLHICFLGLRETAGLGVGCALTTLLFGTITVMVTPGGLGAYPPAVAYLLMLYAVDFSLGQAIGWLVWLSQFAAILIFGSLSLILLPLMNRENAASKDTL